ncbi:hypothetical protein HYV57_02530 [Candidatus Peregrinibacteria bacterium]|nr:hypothetical protein [Candidatus Peregrinibacteria bacterium]
MNTICHNQWCGKKFQISDQEKSFLERISPVFHGKKYEIPVPNICPDCRMQNRVAHRNEQYFYHNTSAVSGKPFISLYAPDNSWGKDSKIVSSDEWWSDDWDGATFGRDFDFSRGFFEQFFELSKNIPKVNLIQVSNENSPYTTGTGYCKNCYLINSSENCENCYYGKLLQTCRDVMDSSYAYDCELLYECFYVRNCYNCHYLSYSQNCFDCWFSENLKGCKNCFLCADLTNKEYNIMNQPVSKEEYKKKLEIVKGSYEQTMKAKTFLSDLRKKRVHKYANIVGCENSTGDFLTNSKSCIDCYDMNDSEDCRLVQVGVNVKDLIDCSNMYLKPELCYQVLGTIGVYNVIFSIYIFHSHDVMYSEFCYNCEYLFGCSGLRNKKYCILNKQYTKEEYEKLVPRVIEHMKKPALGSVAMSGVTHTLTKSFSGQSDAEWGKYFPVKFSPFGYNETLADEYLPLTKKEVENRGWNWHKEESASKKYMGPETKIPDNIREVDEKITEKILVCEATGKLYKIIPQELQFYKKICIPVPRICAEERHKQRMFLRNSRKLYERKCTKCEKPVESTYSPDRLERIYCEECYLKEIY